MLVVIVVGTGYFIHEESGIRVISDFSIITLKTVILIIIIIVISNYVTFTMLAQFLRTFLLEGFFLIKSFIF